MTGPCAEGNEAYFSFSVSGGTSFFHAIPCQTQTRPHSSQVSVVAT
jgi:hypothetical protein